jgi:hypothetical protein
MVVGAVVVAVVVGAGALPASAHERPPRRDALVLGADGITVECGLSVAPGAEARALAEQVDRDRSGRLDADERAALGRFLAARATRHARLSVDGRALSLDDAGVALELPATVDAIEARGIALTARLRAAVRLDDGPHRVVLEDRAPDARVTVAVEIRAEGVRLVEVPRAPLVFAGHPLTIATAPRR